MNETNTDTGHVLADVIEILTADGWEHHRHGRLTTSGGPTRVHLSADNEMLTVTVEYMPGTIVETFHLDLTTGATRIAKIIQTAAEPPEEY